MRPNDVIDGLAREKKAFTVFPGPPMKGIVRRPLTVTYDVPWDMDLGILPEEILHIPYLANLVPTLWALGGRWELPCVDGELFDSFEVIRNGFRKLYPDLDWSGETVPENAVRDLIPSRPPACSRILFFSGGVDSTWSALHCADPSDTLLLTLRGHDVSLRDDAPWRELKGQVESFAAGRGFRTASVTANVLRLLHYGHLHRRHPALKPWYGTVQHGLGIASLAYPLALTLGTSKVIFSASVPRSVQDGPWGSHYLLEPNLRACGVRLVSAGWDRLWVDKVEDIVTHFRNDPDLERPFLRVCLHDMDGHRTDNCGLCEKCLRAMVALLVVGEDPRRWGFPVDPASLAERFSGFRLWRSNQYHWRRLREKAVTMPTSGNAALSRFRDWFLSWRFEECIL